jgi:hypothetical protein
MLRGEAVPREDLGVQLIKEEGVWNVIDNQGKSSPHMG